MSAQEHLKEYFMEVLERVEARKRAMGIAPVHVTSRDFREELKTDLEQAALSLVEEGKIMMGNTQDDEYLIRT